MRLSHLSLTNFRNFVRLETGMPSGPTLLVGANAQGKTSLLEAIYFLVGASSPHASSDRQLIHFLALEDVLPVARIVAEINRQGRPQRIEIRIILEPTGAAGEARLRKEVLINGLKKRVQDLAAGFNAVLFLPQDLQVVEGSPSERRRFLDSTISQVDPTYARASTEYGKVLSQRNALLKQLQERSGDKGELEFWDEQLADSGATLMRARALALHELERRAAGYHERMSQGAETLRLAYQPAFDPTAEPGGQLDLPMETSFDWTSLSREALRQSFHNALAESQREQITRGVTTLGPHRDDMAFRANGLDLRTYGSRGQNRTAMLATKLAEVEWLHEQTGEWPVLLLDEVQAELDPARREALLECVGYVDQAILTAADPSMFTASFREQAEIWRIRAGTLAPYCDPSAADSPEGKPASR
jgi:DNA replication and repair protein RecF